jgi:hypothetical protein
MPTTYETPFTDLPTQWLEASTRVLSASADFYTQALRLQADAARELIETYAGLGSQTTERAAEATTEVTRETGRAAQRATRRTATATRAAVKRAKPAAKVVAKAATAEAPITGYDDLTADELVAKLPEQSQATLALVAAYEKANANRSTVLERVTALSGPEPAPGYDELNADEAQKLVTGGDAALAAAVRDYERRHKNRASVVETAARNADQS